MPAIFVISALCAAIVAAAAPASTPAQSKAPARVIVFTDDSGDPAELASRKTSVKDLTDALAAKKKLFVGTTNEDDAELLIEVIDRAVTVPKVVIGIGPRPGQSTMASGPARAAELRVRLKTRAGEPVDFKNKNKAADNPRGWKSAADDIADQIERWHLARVVR